MMLPGREQHHSRGCGVWSTWFHPLFSFELAFLVRNVPDAGGGAGKHSDSNGPFLCRVVTACAMGRDDWERDTTLRRRH